MTLFQSLVLGIVQGLTEFLPVSSSGHLVIFQHIFGLKESNLTYDVFLHLATLLAVVLFFRQRIIKLQLRDLWLLVIGTIPAGLAAIFLKDQIEASFASFTFANITLIMTGGINFYIDRKLNRQHKPEVQEGVAELKTQSAFLIGVLQAIAIIPGISRSGSTLAGGIWQKLSRQEAFTFSFLLSIPAVLGAVVLELLDVVQSDTITIDGPVFLIGGASAFITGMLSLKLFSYVVNKARMEFFGWYCVVVGAALLAAQALRIL